MDLKNMATESILAEIQKLQDIQKTHRTTSPAWNQAGALLAPLFEEMARRQDGDEK
jgi:hypothetical protein